MYITWRQREPLSVSRMRIGHLRKKRGSVCLSEFNIYAKFKHNCPKIFNREVKRKAMALKLMLHLRKDNIIDIFQQPLPLKQFTMHISIDVAEIQPDFFREKRGMSIQKRVISKRIRRPNFDCCAIAADSTDFFQHMIRTVKMLECMGRIDIFDAFIFEWPAFSRHIKNKIHFGSLNIINADAPGFFLAATANIET